MDNSRNRTSVLRQLAALQDMDREVLEEKWLDLYGSEPPRLRLSFMRRRLAYRIQELFYGGLDDFTKNRLGKVTDNFETKKLEVKIEREGKILPGTRFIREWNGNTYETIARENGFEYNGQLYRSLTAIATAITGTKWNGRKWWGVPNTRKPSE